MKFSKEFKEAIINLPDSEKDKLLLRLLKKDLDLVNKLEFELLGEESVDEKRLELKQRIQEKAKKIAKNFYSLGYLTMDLRYLSGEITEHVKITKDKFGEASLNLLMLNEFLKNNSEFIIKSTIGKSYKLCIYIIARTFKILILIKKLHEDYFVDFEIPLKKLGAQISRVPFLMETAINNGLDVNWLLKAEIPDTIIKLHKEIRDQGFLK